MNRRDGRRKRKKQLRINTSLKKRLYKNIFLAPCCWCQQVFLIDQLTIEHIMPLSLGGGNEDSNIAVACPKCNHDRGKISWNVKRSLMKEKYAQYSAQHS